ncbi:glycosyltransferase [Dissulfurirhabdus thermomarina]|uniref:Glycosyltransferase n=1 Tax=Dissulfurirhabdus thermomarina TaxID=1765737 RepID=A0A6N9TLZ8_DISTH|nr:glycosyltransferase family 2 protein [Dissulfurirhabdus thermomarina]NDY42302.1 glycosyltransferase [Dissulfurirhabdus thermomarina]NMX24161.1 glycosyltransferase [Dissulfurirhabdus thermomarina]
MARRRAARPRIDAGFEKYRKAHHQKCMAKSPGQHILSQGIPVASVSTPADEARKEGGLNVTGRRKKSRWPVKPLISIITVVYNGGRTIEKTIKSVLDQSYKNIEYIIVDGKSTDNTLEIIKKYENRIDYWISEKDEGIYDAMNKGVKKASGDWILFLGADDILLDCLGQFAEIMDNPKNLYYGNVEFSSSGKTYGGKFNLIKLITKNIPHQAIFYPSFAFKEFSFETRYKVLADYALNLRLYAKKDIKFVYVPVCVSIFNDSGMSSRIVDEAFRLEASNIIKECYPITYIFYSFYKKISRYLRFMKP